MEIKRKGLANCQELQHLYWSCHWRKIKEKLAIDASKYGMYPIVEQGTGRKITALTIEEIIQYMEQEADIRSAYLKMNGGYPASGRLDYLAYIAQCISTAIKYPKDQVPSAEEWDKAMYINDDEAC